MLHFEKIEFFSFFFLQRAISFYMISIYVNVD